jgi:hypothetical protein
VPSAQAPVVFAAVVIIVVLVQSPRVHRVARDVISSMRTSSTGAPTRTEAAS